VIINRERERERGKKPGQKFIESKCHDRGDLIQISWGVEVDFILFFTHFSEFLSIPHDWGVVEEQIYYLFFFKAFFNPLTSFLNLSTIRFEALLSLLSPWPC
jgi:hypothetical protein